MSTLTDEIVSAFGGRGQRFDFASRCVGLSRESLAEEVSDYLHEKGINIPGLQEQAERFFAEEAAWIGAAS